MKGSLSLAVLYALMLVILASPISADRAILPTMSCLAG